MVLLPWGSEMRLRPKYASVDFSWPLARERTYFFFLGGANSEESEREAGGERRGKRGRREREKREKKERTTERKEKPEN